MENELLPISSSWEEVFHKYHDDFVKQIVNNPEFKKKYGMYNNYQPATDDYFVICELH